MSYLIKKGLMMQGGYSADAQAVIDRMSGLTTAEKDAIAVFVDAGVANGNWALIDEFWCFGLDTEANSLIGWKSKTATNNGATHGSTGFNFNGSSDYIDSNFVPSIDGNNIGVNNCFMGCYVKTIADSNTRMLYGENVSSPDIVDLFQAGGNQYTRMLDNGGSDVMGAAQGNDTLLYGSRISSAQKRVYANGATLGTFNRARNGNLPANSVYVGARRTVGGGAITHWKGILGSFIVAAEVGFNHSAHNTNIRTLLTSLGVI